jgi:2-polyprenyl-3-methyl-5-hydroxy-6-metoxy-1,4-benzoquinol methylase
MGQQNRTASPSSREVGGKQQVEDFDSTNHIQFTTYYESQSSKSSFVEGINRLKNVLVNFYASHANHPPDKKLIVADIGCGPGTQAIAWAQDGHQVYGIDVSERFIELAQERMSVAGVIVDFRVGTATHLPFPSASMDVCLLPELLEHVPNWLNILEECVRILKPNGLLYISTSNVFCPVQNEYTLALYSWYPSFVKRICEEKAVTTHKHWVNFASYPAINWFSNPSLEKRLNSMGFRCYDRLDLMDLSNKPAWVAWVVNKIVPRVPLLRYISYFLSSATIVAAIKHPTVVET